jgi:formylglycine-generating enzyme required for sulfatase activity
VKGKDFARQIEGKIRAAKVLIVLWCTKSVGSEWVNEEVDLAKELGTLIPTKIEDCELPVGSRLKDYIDLTHWDGSPRSHLLDSLLDAIAQKVGRDPAPNFRALQEYEATWRRFGAPSLRAFALEKALEASVGARQFPHRAGTESSPGAPGAVRWWIEQDRIRAEGRMRIDAKSIRGAPYGWFKPGAGKTEWFKDHEHGPEMVVVPAGEFIMGSKDYGNEKPPHRVTIRQPFAVGRFAVTFDEWDAAVADGGCSRYRPTDKGWGRGKRPVINVSWHDAQAYVAWLSQRTARFYRLLSEAEWEYCARAGTITAFWWDDRISTKLANYKGDLAFGGGPTGEYPERTLPVDSFEPNPWGLYQVHGNVYEWCEDIWNNTYEGAPADGAPWVQRRAWLRLGRSRRVIRGGGWFSNPRNLRSAYRFRYVADLRLDDLGFRVAATL